MIESLIKNLNQDIALLQRRIERDKDVGFYDTSRMLESMSIQLFRVLGIAELKSKNQIKVNFPAIDSADDNARIALQVTSVADAKKIKDTIEMFEKQDANGKSLKGSYDTLYIFGFCKTSSVKTRDYCQVIDPGFLLNELIEHDDEGKVQLVINAIRRHLDYSSLHPYADIDCLKIMLSHIGRNAIRHYMSCEGDVHAMTKGLNEVSELIGKGSIDGKSKSKALHEFTDQKIAKFLRGVLDQIGGITAIVHKASRDDGFVCLSSQNMQALDKRKQAIAESAENIAKLYGIDVPLAMHRRDD